MRIKKNHHTLDILRSHLDVEEKKIEHIRASCTKKKKKTTKSNKTSSMPKSFKLEMLLEGRKKKYVFGRCTAESQLLAPTNMVVRLRKLV
jgi:hypothetical protein